MNDADLKLTAQAAEAGYAQMTLNELEKTCAEAYELKAQMELIEEKLSELGAELRQKQAKILAVMTAYEKSSYRSSAGLLVVQKRFTVQHPKDPEKRKLFFDWLREKGVFEDMVSVHSQTLNSFYKEQMTAAIEAGETDFAVPGVDEPKLLETLVMRKK